MHALAYTRTPLHTVCGRNLQLSAPPRTMHALACTRAPRLHTVESHAQVLWTESPIELAAHTLSSLSAPCMRMIVHRHSRYLLESYDCGDYPGSSARIPQNTQCAAAAARHGARTP